MKTLKEQTKAEREQNLKNAKDYPHFPSVKKLNKNIEEFISAVYAIQAIQLEDNGEITVPVYFIPQVKQTLSGWKSESDRERTLYTICNVRDKLEQFFETVLAHLWLYWDKLPLEALSDDVLKECTHLYVKETSEGRTRSIALAEHKDAVKKLVKTLRSSFMGWLTEQEQYKNKEVLQALMDYVRRGLLSIRRVPNLAMYCGGSVLDASWAATRVILSDVPKHSADYYHRLAQCCNVYLWHAHNAESVFKPKHTGLEKMTNVPLLKGKKVLLIGSGKDLNGRKLNERISAPDCEWDYIARINHPFGDVEDVGKRMDLCFVGDKAWAEQYFPAAYHRTNGHIIAFKQGTNCSPDYREHVAEILGFAPLVSSGLAAVYWLLSKGAEVEIIGFNAPGGKVDFSGEKVYHTGQKDGNPTFDWTAEILWIKSQEHVTLL